MKLEMRYPNNISAGEMPADPTGKMPVLRS